MNLHSACRPGRVRPHIIAMWTPLTRKRGCGLVVAPLVKARERTAEVARGFESHARRFFGISSWGSENFEKLKKRPKSTQILILFFGALGTGKIDREDFWSKTNAFPYFIFFRNLKMRLRQASCKKFPEKIISRYTNRKKPYQKSDHFSKWRLQNDDVMETQSIFKGYHLAVTIWRNLLAGWLAWPVGGF